MDPKANSDGVTELVVLVPVELEEGMPNVLTALL